VTVIEAATWHDQELKGSMKGDGARVEGEGDDEDWVWGVAYRIDLEKEVEVRAYLGDFSSITTSYDERALANTTDQEHREKVCVYLIPRGTWAVVLLRMDIHRMRFLCIVRHLMGRARS